LPIIYLHDFLIGKTQKKKRKKALPIIYLHGFLIEKTDLFFFKQIKFVPSVIILPTLNIPEVWNQLGKKNKKGSVSSSQAFTVKFYVQF